MSNEPDNTYFLPYQRAWRADSARLKICQKSRQIGLSYVDSYDSVTKAALREGRDVWVMSRDEAQAKQYIRYCKHWANILQLAAIDHGEQVFTGRDGKAVQVQVLSFASRARIYALSSNPDAIVGKTGHVKLDEFALHKDQRTLYAVAKPVIQWGGTLSIISTHRGAGTVFNEIIEDVRYRGNRMGWSLHTIPIQTAVEQGLVEKINAATGAQDSREAWLMRQRAECIDEEQWLQEYCCMPADETTAFISYDLINACTEPGLRLFSAAELIEQVKTARRAELFLGVDVARKKDLCVLDVGERVGDVIWDRVRIELLNRSFSEIEEQLYQLLALSQLKRACVDASGMGLQLAERARERFEWKVEPITFTAPTKEALATGLKVDLEKRQVRLVDDTNLRADLRGIRKEVTFSGNHRYAGESHDSHCDRFWAKALRQEAARHRECAGALVA
ncbi:MAG TPA: terminase family protein [Candidatus Limnocylindrales bacterium]|nr:terminase family protein [Candidatus Limnocylindrales bacterium]